MFSDVDTILSNKNQKLYGLKVVTCDKIARHEKLDYEKCFQACWLSGVYTFTMWHAAMNFGGELHLPSLSYGKIHPSLTLTWISNFNTYVTLCNKQEGPDHHNILIPRSDNRNISVLVYIAIIWHNKIEYSLSKPLGTLGI